MEIIKYHPEKIAPLVEDMFYAAKNCMGIFANYHSENTPEKKLMKLTSDKKTTSLIILNFSSINRMTSSESVADNTVKAFNEKSDLFDPQYIREEYESWEKLKPDIMEYFPHMPNENPKSWFVNAHLLENYDDDPRNIVNLSEDESQMIKTIDQFRGIGLKQAALTLYWYHRDGICNGYNPAKFPIPIDTHVLHRLHGAGVFEIDDQIRREKVLKPLHELFDKYFEDNPEYDKFLFQEYLWILGSQACHTGRCDDLCVRREKCTVDLDGYLWDSQAIMKPISIDK